MLRRRSIAAGGWLLDKYLRAAVRSLDTEWYTQSNGGLVREPPDVVVPHIVDLRRRRPLLIPFWNAHSLLLLAAYLTTEELKGALRNVEAVADDSVGGYLTQSLFRRAGLPLRLIRHAAQAERLMDIESILTDKPSLVMAIDSHGPYRFVSTPTARLAKTLGATVLPISAASNQVIKVFRKIGMSVPLPRARIRVAIAAPIECHSISISAVRQLLAQSLVVLENELHATVR